MHLPLSGEVVNPNVFEEYIKNSGVKAEDVQYIEILYLDLFLQYFHM